MQLVITEKPSVARAIAEVLGATNQKQGYLEGNGYLISWCIGHLIELAQPQVYGEEYESWSIESLPILPEHFEYEVKEATKVQFQVLYQLMHDDRVEQIVCATDAGREGELIFRLVYKKIGCTKEVKRLWISSMEEQAIRDGFCDLKPSDEYDALYLSAMGRQQADWLVGMNGTRLFTCLYGGKTLKVGRVQSPTLAMIVDREEARTQFKKEPFFTVALNLNGMEVTTARLDDKAQANVIKEQCQGKPATIIKLVKKEHTLSAPKLYDLTTLQREANRLFGYHAKQTLEYAQSLYEKKLITYPRTDSNYLTEDMEQKVMEIIQILKSKIEYVKDQNLVCDVKKLINNQKVSDHHAIIPTMELMNTDLKALPASEYQLLYLIVNRLICGSSRSFLYEQSEVKACCEEIFFTASWKEERNKGWKEVDEHFCQTFSIKMEQEKAQNVIALTESMVFEGVESKVLEHETSMPKRFNEDTLLLAMERAGGEKQVQEEVRKGLGTPATRADIIEKLVREGYIKREKKQLVPTEDGIKLITILPSSIKSPQLTAEWEYDLLQIANGELHLSTFMDKIQCMIRYLITTYQEVSGDQKEWFLNTQKAKVLGTCPKCGGEILTGKYGSYCTKKCGMYLGKAMGATLSEREVIALLQGKKILVKGLKGKSRKNYDAYLIPVGIEEYDYTKNGESAIGYQFKFKLEFPNQKKQEKNKS